MVAIVVKNKEDLDSISKSMETVDLIEYWRAINVRKWWIFLLIVVSVVTTFALTGQSVDYRASTTIALSSTAARTFNTPNALNRMIRSDDLLTDVIKQSKLKYTVSDLRPRVHAENIGGPDMVTIFITDSRPANAKKIANIIASQFIKQTKIVLPSENRLATRLSATRKLLAWIDTMLNNDDLENIGPDEINQKLLLVNQRTTLVNQEVDIINQIDRMASTKIIVPASKPTTPISPNIKTKLLFSGLAALIAGIGLAMAFTSTNKEVAA